MKLNNRGETIVEVLLSIAVVGLALSASFVLANRSTQAMRQAQERSEALKFTEEQVERLQSYLKSGSAQPIAFETDFCLAPPENEEGGGSGVDIVPQQGVDKNSLAGYSSRCLAGPDGRYHMSVRKATTRTYTFETHWYRVSGTGIDRLSINYRSYD